MLKSSYTEWKTLSLYDALGKVYDYIKEIDSDYKCDSEIYVTKNALVEAEKYWKKNKDKILKKCLKNSKSNHRTLIKKDYGVLTGTTAEIWAFPTSLTDDVDHDLFVSAASKYFYLVFLFFS